MSSKIDFAIAVGLFFMILAFLLKLVFNQVSTTLSLSYTSDLQTKAYDFFNALQSGIPSNWEEFNRPPVRIGIISDIYRIPIVVMEKNSTDRNNVTINLTVDLDNNCINRAWNNTVRVYDQNATEITSSLFNQTFCTSGYLNKTDLVLNLSLNANQNRTFFIYFSPDKNISAPSYSLSFPDDAINYSILIFPEDKLSAVSVQKLLALRKLNYDDVIQTFFTGYKFNLEIVEK